jgi:hypothetical protein
MALCGFVSIIILLSTTFTRSVGGSQESEQP